MLNAIYGSIAIALNDYENHRTDTQYEDALIAKTFIFQYVNSFASLFYISFIKPYMQVRLFTLDLLTPCAYKLRKARLEKALLMAKKRHFNIRSCPKPSRSAAKGAVKARFSWLVCAGCEHMRVYCMALQWLISGLCQQRHPPVYTMGPTLCVGGPTVPSAAASVVCIVTPPLSISNHPSLPPPTSTIHHRTLTPVSAAAWQSCRHLSAPSS